MSSEAASIMTRFEDLMRKYLRKLAPLMSKVGLSYDIGQNFEKTEKSFIYSLLNFVSKLNAKFYLSEKGFYKRYRFLVNSLLSLQAQLEDALSFSSLYMNLLLVFALVLMVVWAWTS